MSSQWRQKTSIILTAAFVFCVSVVLLHSTFIQPQRVATMRLWLVKMWPSLLVMPLIGTAAVAQKVDLGWYPPSNTSINNLTAALTSQGIYGFIFNTSETPDGQYGTYNWCNMPHVRKSEYVKPVNDYELSYVEVVRLTPALNCLHAMWLSLARFKDTTREHHTRVILFR